MHWLATLLLGLALLAPGPAGAHNVGSGECRHLDSQIDFFEGRVERARTLGNPMWEERLGTHLANLEERRDERCPNHDDQAAMEALQRLIELAAKGALTFFTLGML